MTGKVAVIGCDGQLGVELVREVAARGHQVGKWDRPQIDISHRGQVEDILTQFDPELVINAAAYNQVDVAESEPQAALEANALGVRNLAMVCRQLDARFVHYSTDYVFDGRAGRPYTEQDPTHPLGAYGISKLAGEICAQAYLENPLILRTSGVFGVGGLRTPRGNFIEVMLRLAQSRQAIRVVEDHVASPTYAPYLAARTMDLVERGVTGILHVGGGTPISWFEYAKLIFHCAGLTPELRPTSEREYRTAARRPKYSALSNAKMDSLGFPPLPSLETAVKDYLAKRERAVASSSTL